MTDYSSLGLDQNLQPLNSPITNYGTGDISGMGFDSVLDRASITNSQIRNLSIDNAKIGTAAIGTANIGTLTFNEISGGTATLGGTANGDGVVSVQNAGGTEIVQINNQGIRVTGGSIVVINSTGGTVVDTSGVVSLTNFNGANSVASFTGTIIQSFTDGTAYTDITGGSLQIVTARPVNVLFLADGIFTMSITGTASTEAREFFALNVGGSIQEQAIQTARIISGLPYGELNSFFSQSIHNYGTVAAGTTNVKLQVRHAKVLGAGTTGTDLWTYKLTYVILGS